MVACGRALRWKEKNGGDDRWGSPSEAIHLGSPPMRSGRARSYFAPAAAPVALRWKSAGRKNPSCGATIVPAARRRRPDRRHADRFAIRDARDRKKPCATEREKLWTDAVTQRTHNTHSMISEVGSHLAARMATSVQLGK